MTATTIQVTKDFPMRPGEVLRIRNANGKGIWRTYFVGEQLNSNADDKRKVFAATMRRG